MDYTTLLSVVPIILIVGIILYLIIIGKNQTEVIKKIPVAIVSIILVVVIAIPVVNISITGNSTLAYYDDYLPADNVESVDGCFELITIDGVEYVHANSLGKGVIKYDDGTEEKYYTEKAILDVFLLMGQSNAANYRYDKTIAEPIPEMGTSYYYGTSTNLMYWGSANPNNPQYDTTFASYDMYDMVYGDEAKVGNVDLPFAGEYTEDNSHKVYVINAAIPSASINIFQPNGIAFNYCKNVFAHAMDCIDYSKYNVSVKGFIWIQGEQDYNMTVDEYKTKFMNFMDCVDWMGTPKFNDEYKVPICLISKVRVKSLELPASGINAINPAQAQIELAEEYNNIYMATEITDTFTVQNGLMLSDDGHYSQTGDNLIGKNVATYYKTNLI